MTTTNLICIVPAAAKDDCNAVLEAMGIGSGSLSVRLTTASSPHWSATATHFGMSYQSAPLELQTQLLAATQGDLPPVTAGVVWGENGVISAAAAMAAMAQLAVAAFSNLFEPIQQLGAAMAAYDPPLSWIPDNDEE